MSLGLCVSRALGPRPPCGQRHYSAGHSSGGTRGGFRYIKNFTAPQFMQYPTPLLFSYPLISPLSKSRTKRITRAHTLRLVNFSVAAKTPREEQHAHVRRLSRSIAHQICTYLEKGSTRAAAVYLASPSTPGCQKPPERLRRPSNSSCIQI